MTSRKLLKLDMDHDLMGVIENYLSGVKKDVQINQHLSINTVSIDNKRHRLDGLKREFD